MRPDIADIGLWKTMVPAVNFTNYHKSLNSNVICDYHTKIDKFSTIFQHSRMWFGVSNIPVIKIRKEIVDNVEKMLKRN